VITALALARSPHRRQRIVLLVLLAIGTLVLAWVFTKLASEVLEGELSALDVTVQHWARAHRSTAALGFFRVVTNLGAKEVLLPLGVLIGWRLFPGTRAALALLAFSALAAGEFVGLLKRNFHIMRPAGGVEAGLGFSFPSGHATGATAVCVAFAYVSVRQRAHPWIIVPICALIILLVGISRVYLDVHWASDVLGGWLVGAAFGAGTCALYELLHGTAGTADMTAELKPDVTADVTSDRTAV